MSRRSESIGFLFAVCALMLSASGCGDKEGLSEARAKAIRETPVLGLPAGASQIAVIDVNRFRQFSIYEEFREAFLRDPGRMEAWNELSRRFGEDPLTKVDQIIFGGYAPKFNRPMENVILIITGSWGDNQAFLDAFCLLASKGFLDNPPPFEPVEIERVPNAFKTSAVSTLHPGEPVNVYAAFPAAGICILSMFNQDEVESNFRGKVSRLDRFRRSNDVMFEREDGVLQDPGWAYHLSKIKFDEPIWAAGWIPNLEWRDYITEKIKSTPELDGLWGLAHNHPLTFFAYFNSESRYLFDLQTISETAGDADKFAYDLNRARRVVPRILMNWFPDGGEKVALWQEMIDKIETRTEGTSIYYKLEMPEDDADRLIRVSAAPAVATPTPEPVPDPFKRR